jgi:hypothetical protein
MKIFEFIRKHWLLFIEIIGGAVLAILFFLGLTNNPGKPLLPTIDVKIKLIMRLKMKLRLLILSLNKELILLMLRLIKRLKIIFPLKRN